MIKYLITHFVKNYKNTSSPLVKQSYATLCSTVGVALNVLLFIVKVIVGTISGSLSIVADGVNNITDAGSSLAAFLGFRLAAIGGGKNHPFGHGRYEWLMGFLSALIVFIVGVVLAKNSILSVFSPQEAEFSGAVLLVLVCSILVKLYMYLYNKRYAVLIDSSAMKATAMDSVSDMAATTAILLSLIFQHYTGIIVDGWCSLLVSIFIITSGWKAITETVERLLGQSPDQAVFEKVKKIAISHKEVTSVNNLVIHDYGLGRYVISMRVVGAENTQYSELISVVNDIEYELSLEVTCETTIEIAYMETDPKVIKSIQSIIEIVLLKVNPNAKVSQLNVQKSKNYSNVFITIEGPDKLRKEEEELSSAIEQQLHTLNAKYRGIIKLVIAHPNRER